MPTKPTKTKIDPVFHQPWLITPSWLSSMAMPGGEPEAVATSDGEPVGESNLIEMYGTVAVVNIRGPIMRYGASWSRFYRCTPIESLAKEFKTVVDDPSVTAILLNVDSPGGQVNGTHEMAEMIFRAMEKKPVKAYVGCMGTSGAYWLATSAEEVILDATAEVGSIGVVTMYIDFREWDKKNGIEEIEIISSSSPKKRPDPATDAGKKQIQGQLDALADVFIGTVARNRKVPEETVRSDFGQGDVIIGAEAVNRGMADRLGSFEQVLSELQTISTNNREDNFMPDITMDVIAKDHPEIAEAFRKEGFEAGQKEGREAGLAQGRTEERERIKGIEAMAVPGHDALINKLKFEEPASAEQVAMRILEAEKAVRANVAQNLAEDAAALEGVSPEPPADDSAAAAEEEAALKAMVEGGNDRRI